MSARRLVERIGARAGASTAMMGSIATGVFGQALLVVTGVVVARALGPEHRGVLALVWAVSAIAVQIGSLGVPVAVTYWIAGRNVEPRTVLGSLRRFRRLQLVAVLAAQALLLVVVLEPRSPSGFMRVALLTLAATAAGLAQMYGLAVLQGLGAFGAFNVLRLSNAVLYLLGVVVLWALGHATLTSVTLVLVAAAVGAAAVTALAVGRAVRARRSSDESDISTREVISFGLRSLVGSSPPVETFRLDQLLVGLVLSPVALGYFVVATAFTNLTRFVGQSIGMITYPRVAAAGDPAEHVRIMRRHFALGAAVCGALTLVLAALVPALLPFFFGPEFEPAGTAAKILLLGTLFAALRRILVDGTRGAGRPLWGAGAEAVTLVALPGVIVVGQQAGSLTSVAWVVAASNLLGLLVVAPVLVTGTTRKESSTSAWLRPRSVSAASWAFLGAAAMLVVAGVALAVVTREPWFTTVALGTLCIAALIPGLIAGTRLYGDVFSLLNVATVFYLLTFGVGGLYFAFGNPIGMLGFDRAHIPAAILLGLISWGLLALGYVLTPRPLRALLPKLRFSSAASPIAVAAILAGVGWLARLQTIRHGLYFHVPASGEIVSTGSSWLITAAAALPTLATAYVGARSYIDRPEHVVRVTYYVLWLVELAWAVPTGSRANVLTLFAIAVILPYYGRERRLPVRLLTVGALVGVFVVLPFGLAYRGDNKHFQSHTKESLQAALSTVTSRSPTTMAMAGLESTTSRFSGAVSVAAIVGQGRDIPEYRHGDSLRWIPEGALPRAVYPKKADPGVFGNVFGRTYGILAPTDRITGITVTQPGELYINFGLLGILLGMPLVGVLYHVADGLFRQRAHPGVLAVFSVCIWQFLNGSESILVLGVFGVLKFAVFFAGALFFATRLVRMLATSRMRAAPALTAGSRP